MNYRTQKKTLRDMNRLSKFFPLQINRSCMSIKMPFSFPARVPFCCSGLKQHVLLYVARRLVLPTIIPALLCVVVTLPMYSGNGLASSVLSLFQCETGTMVAEASAIALPSLPAAMSPLRFPCLPHSNPTTHTRTGAQARTQRRHKMSFANVLPVLLVAALVAAGSSSSSSSSSRSPEQHPHNRPDEAFQCDVNRETRATIAFKALELLKMNDFRLVKTGIFAGHVRTLVVVE